VSCISTNLFSYYFLFFLVVSRVGGKAKFRRVWRDTSAMLGTE
jgi:hypothetical protein